MTTQTTERPAAAGRERIDAATHLGVVTLRVADLERSVSFYEQVIGLEVTGRDAGAARLGAGGATLLELRELPGARPVPARATGLFHVAILLPSQGALGRALQRMAAAGVPVGQGDHLVSEALYLSDPDGNGLEVYRDRPRDSWRWKGDQIQMDTLTVDLRGLLAAAEREGAAPERAPEGTVVGHVHLKVDDLEVARAFFEGALGFDVVAQMPGALFVSAGGYHHHFGLNTWQSRGAGPAPASAAGLVSYTIALPDTAALERVAARLAERGVAHSREGADVVARDPWGGRLVLTADAQA